MLPLNCVLHMIVTWKYPLNKHSNVDYSNNLLGSVRAGFYHASIIV